MKPKGFATRAIHVGQSPDPSTGAVVRPIYQTSTYWQASPGEHQGYEYSRTQNPTRESLEQCLASLENTKFGACFASGMAAITTLMHILPPQSHVICSADLYGGTFRLFDKVLKAYGHTFSFVDLEAQQNNWDALMQANTRMLWIETPSNPMLGLVDIQTLSTWAKKKKIWVVVDNTFASPYLQQPLDLGADMVVHSLTKYIAGHSDLVGGFIGCQSDALGEKIAFLQNSMGGILGPFDAWLALRGLKTLELRMEKHCENAQALAEYLEQHPKVARVIYPGLKSHPQHALATRQMKRFGGMVSFYFKGDLEETKAVLSRLSLFFLAESLGGVESLAEHPAIMTHASVPEAQRNELGISDNFIRLSVGIENIADLRADLASALG